MPTATFLNLPKEKQTKILNAAKHEFGKNSVEEASVKTLVNSKKSQEAVFMPIFMTKKIYIIIYWKNTVHKFAVSFILV